MTDGAAMADAGEDTPNRTAPDRLPAGVLAVIALGAAVIAAGTTFYLTRDDGGSEALTAAAPVVVDDRSSTSTSTSTTTSSTSTTTSTTVTSTTTTTIAPAPAPVVGATGPWIAVLASIPTGEGQAAADARLTELRATAPWAQLLLSDDYPALRAGYFVVYQPAFASGDAATAFCSTSGFSVPDQCYARAIA